MLSQTLQRAIRRINRHGQSTMSIFSRYLSSELEMSKQQCVDDHDFVTVFAGNEAKGHCTWDRFGFRIRTRHNCIYEYDIVETDHNNTCGDIENKWTSSKDSIHRWTIEIKETSNR